MESHGDTIARKVASSGLLLALAVLFGYVEAIIPVPMPVPGMKLGLANIVIVTILYLAGWKEAIVISALRVLIIGFLFGNLFSISYGLAGTALSILGMALVRKTRRFSVVSVSALGGVLHNCGQILVATLVVIGFPWKWYLPVLMLAGLGAGIVTGFLNRLIIPRVKKVVAMNLS
ncbi:MAG: Gx transporter family protein [Porcincola intestinalis]|uniref:Gx transporter family protein n=1 Tax=Porcincola intestinalis TaxID=2606632 RepID=UPI0029DA84F4|nr:Gx transporter family protein [Porcincola intestinalis]MCI6239580.1 Gx transporter family protein [Lachnospiraceae bacterium]MDY5331926.1 Gx transporter family protein [Porcincola intestinalis]MDY5579375.1 Gx transporter family protein [Porcincola intestinalis]